MKNKVNKVKIAIAFLITFGTITTTSSTKPKIQVDDLFLSNVEALASGEGTRPINCLNSGSVDCPYTTIKVKYVMSYGY